MIGVITVSYTRSVSFYIISQYANFSEITLISIGVLIRDRTAGNVDRPWYLVTMKFDINFWLKPQRRQRTHNTQPHKTHKYKNTCMQRTQKWEDWVFPS